jgi:hypothetical protein
MIKMSKIYQPLTKETMVQGLKFKIKALTFEDLRVLSAIDKSNVVEFAKTVMERGVLESEGDISTLSLPIYMEVLKEVMEFSGLGQTNNMFNPSLRQQTP